MINKPPRRSKRQWPTGINLISPGVGPPAFARGQSSWRLARVMQSWADQSIREAWHGAPHEDGSEFPLRVGGKLLLLWVLVLTLRLTMEESDPSSKGEKHMPGIFGEWPPFCSLPICFVSPLSQRPVDQADSLCGHQVSIFQFSSKSVFLIRIFAPARGLRARQLDIEIWHYFPHSYQQMLGVDLCICFSIVVKRCIFDQDFCPCKQGCA